MLDEAKPISLSPGRPARERILRRLLLVLDRLHGPRQDFLLEMGFASDLATFIETDLPMLAEEDLWWLSSMASVALADADAESAGRAPFRQSDWRLLFYCLTSSRTLKEAIERMGELFHSVDGRFGSISIGFRGTDAVLRLSGKRGTDREVAFIVALNGLTMFNSILSWMIGKPLARLVEFDFDESHRSLVDEDVLPFELRLGCSHPAIIFDSNLLRAPILRGIHDCEQLPSLNLMMLMTSQPVQDETMFRVKRLLRSRLERDESLANLDDVAAALQLSVGTLRRRIRASGTSFRALREEVRRDTAIALLSNPALSIEDVAFKLDFCDSDALRHAIRKWTGMAPSAYRRALLDRH